jgi:hypothetical protein
MRAICATLGYMVAAALILLGADELFHKAARAWYFDGTITVDASGHVVPDPVPSWMGAAIFALGALMAAAIRALARKR